MYPRIDYPCPLRSIDFPAQGNFNCAVCKREVHNLSAMTIDQREQFLLSCSGEVCVSYKVKSTELDWTKGAIAGLFALTAAGLAVPLAAQPTDGLLDNMEEILVGGVKLPEKLNSHSNYTHSKKVAADMKSELQLIPIVEEVEVKKNEDSSSSTN